MTSHFPAWQHMEHLKQLWTSSLRLWDMSWSPGESKCPPSCHPHTGQVPVPNSTLDTSTHHSLQRNEQRFEVKQSSWVIGCIQSIKNLHEWFMSCWYSDLLRHNSQRKQIVIFIWNVIRCRSSTRLNQRSSNIFIFQLEALIKRNKSVVTAL